MNLFSNLSTRGLIPFFIEDLIDPAHAALAQLFDDLVAAGESGASG